MALWLISYDISDNRIRREAIRILADAGARRLQESVFEAWFDHRALVDLKLALTGVIDPLTDAVCAWPQGQPDNERRQGSTLPLSPLPGHWIL